MGLQIHAAKPDRNPAPARTSNGSRAAWLATALLLSSASRGAGSETPGSGVSDPLQSTAPRSATSAADDLILIAEQLYLGDGTLLAPGSVWIEDGVIRAVGTPGAVQAAAAGSSAPRITAAVATPGLIDARSSLGLAGWLNTEHDKDEVDHSEPLQPELRAVDGFNAEDPLLAWVRGFGVTTVHTGHAPRALISGQTMIVKTAFSSDWERAILVPEAMLSVSLGEQALTGKSPGTRPKALAILRQALIDAQHYAADQGQEDPTKRPARDLRKEALARALGGELPFLIYAQRTHDLLTAFRLGREFPGLRLVIEGGAEIESVLEEFRASGAKLVLHPTMARPSGETRSLSMATAGHLAEWQLPFALQSGYEDYVPRTRVVLFEAGVAAQHGLPREAAIRALTLDAAELLGIDARVGSLAVGKDGDLALFDGDPLESTSHCVGTYIEGRLVSAGERGR